MERKEIQLRQVEIQPQVQVEGAQMGKFGELISKYQFGGLELTPEQREILYKDFADEEIEIRPDGLIYVPWFRYVERLRRAGLSFVFVPEGTPKYVSEANLVIWGFWLIINDRVVGFAYGEATYHPDNPRMTYGDAIEAAKSNAIMRLCKDLGIGSLKIWDPSFVEEWKRKYAVSYKDENGRIVWKKRPQIQVQERQEEDKPKETPIKGARKIFSDLIKTHFLPPEDWVKLIKRINEVSQITDEQISDAIAWIKEKTKDRTKGELYKNAIRWRDFYYSKYPREFFPPVEDPDYNWTVEELKKYIDKIRNIIYEEEIEIAKLKIEGKYVSGEDNPDIQTE